MVPRAGGRTSQGRGPAPTPDGGPGRFRPAREGAPPAQGRPVPRGGGRTQQGARQLERTGGRTQQSHGNVDATADALGADRDRGGPPGSPTSATAPPGQASSPGTARSAPARVPSKTSVAKVTHQGAGLLVAAFVWPLGVNLLKGGPGQMWGWVKAKFINQPYTGAAGSGTGGSAGGGRHGRKPGGGPGKKKKKG